MAIYDWKTNELAKEEKAVRLRDCSWIVVVTLSVGAHMSTKASNKLNVLFL